MIKILSDNHYTIAPHATLIIATIIWDVEIVFNTSYMKGSTSLLAGPEFLWYRIYIYCAADYTVTKR